MKSFFGAYMFNFAVPDFGDYCTNQDYAREVNPPHHPNYVYLGGRARRGCPEQILCHSRFNYKKTYDFTIEFMAKYV